MKHPLKMKIMKDIRKDKIIDYLKSEKMDKAFG